MTYASASTAAIVRIDNARSRAVRPMIANTRPSGTPSKNPEMNVANSAAEPDADSTLNVNFAAYGAGFATTGGSRWICPSTPGQANVMVALSSSALNGP